MANLRNVEPELRKPTYAYCTFKGCHWWLELEAVQFSVCDLRSLSGEAIDDVVVRFSGMSLNPDE